MSWILFLIKCLPGLTTFAAATPLMTSSPSFFAQPFLHCMLNSYQLVLWKAHFHVVGIYLYTQESQTSSWAFTFVTGYHHTQLVICLEEYPHIMLTLLSGWWLKGNEIVQIMQQCLYSSLLDHLCQSICYSCKISGANLKPNGRHVSTYIGLTVPMHAQEWPILQMNRHHPVRALKIHLGQLSILAAACYDLGHVIQ